MDSTFCDLILFEGDESKYKFEHVQDRIFVLSNSNNFTFFWLQDITTEQDEDLTQTIAGYVHHPASAYPAADTAADPPVIATPNSNTNTNTNTNTSSNTAAAAAAATNDNLGNILESVRASSSTTAATTATTTEAATTQPVPSTTNNTTSNTTSQLTLADLQGAMAGLATSNVNVNNSAKTNNNAKTKLPLTEIATPEHLMECGILEDEAVTNKLISLLPEGQQTKEMLLQHLHLSTNTNPQVRSALQSLTAALASGPEGFHGVVMNFQLPLDAGNANLADNDPIQAFLDCLVAQVEREGESVGDGDGDGDGDGEVKEDDN